MGVLTPGVYTFDSTAQLTGTLTLNFAGMSDAEFVFQIGSSLTTASASDVVVENGNSTDAIYWEVGSSATLGTTTDFAGNIIADQSISLNTNAEILCGRAIALVAAVTLEDNTISNDCNAYNASRARRRSGGRRPLETPSRSWSAPLPSMPSSRVNRAATASSGAS